MLELLELLGRSTKAVSLREVVEELAYPKSSAHALLSTLVSKGYAVRDEGERYSLNSAYRNGPGWLSGPDARLIELAEPVMQDLRDSAGETVMLGVLMRDHRLKTIAKTIGNQAVRYDSELSGGLPSYCAAMGRLLLSYLESKQIDRYLAKERIVKLTDFTIVDRIQLRHLIDEAGRQGYGTSDREMDIDGCGIAGPIRDSTGTVIAALDVAAVASRYERNYEHIRTQVLRCSAALSSRMGWR